MRGGVDMRPYLIAIHSESSVTQKVFIETVISQADQTYMHTDW